MLGLELGAVLELLACELCGLELEAASDELCAGVDEDACGVLMLTLSELLGARGISEDAKKSNIGCELSMLSAGALFELLSDACINA